MMPHRAPGPHDAVGSRSRSAVRVRRRPLDVVATFDDPALAEVEVGEHLRGARHPDAMAVGVPRWRTGVADDDD